MSVHHYNKKIVYISEELKVLLAEITDYPCTVVTAPAHFGKSTVVREYFIRLQQGEYGNARDCETFWMTLTGESAAFFGEDFSEQFSKINADFAQILNIETLTDSRQWRRLFKTLSVMENLGNKDIVLIIDANEYKFPNEAKEFFELFIKNLPEWLHIVLMGRYSPLKYNSVLFLLGVVHFITRDNLCLNAADIEKYYRMSGITYNHKDAKNLSCVSEECISVIRLNLLEYITTGKFLDYKMIERTIENVFYFSLPANYQDFLNRVCVCESFSEIYSEYLCGDGAKDILYDLVQQNIFVTQDKDEGTYHLNNIFSSSVKRVFNRLSREEQIERYNKAGDCFMKTKHFRVAREFYYLAQNFEALMEAVEKRRYIHPYTIDEQDFVSYYIDCPPEIRARHPRAIFVFARHLFNSDRQEQAWKVLSEYKQAVKESTTINDTEKQRLEAMYELLLAYTCYNDLEMMLTHLHNAKKIIEEPSDEVLWPETGLFEIPSILYMYHRKVGELSHEVDLFREYNQLYMPFSGFRTVGAELIMRAEMLYMTGKLEEAKIQMYEAEIVANRNKRWGVWNSVKFLQIRIEMQSGNWKMIEFLLNETKKDFANVNYYMYASVVDLCEAFIYCKLNMPSKLGGMFKVGWDNNLNANFRVVPTIYAFCAEVMLSRKEYIPLIALSKKYLDTSRIFPNLMAEIHLLIVLAAAHKALNEQENALQYMRNALDLALPDCILMPFVEFGSHIGSLLLIISKTSYKGKIDKILELLADYSKKLDSIRDCCAQDVVIGLTVQENNIARLAAARMRNKEIAERMFISESTVKTHLARVFEKLDIKKRSQLKSYFFSDVPHDPTQVS